MENQSESESMEELLRVTRSQVPQLGECWSSLQSSDDDEDIAAFHDSACRSCHQALASHGRRHTGISACSGSYCDCHDFNRAAGQRDLARTDAGGGSCPHHHHHHREPSNHSDCPAYPVVMVQQSHSRLSLNSPLAVSGLVAGCRCSTEAMALLQEPRKLDLPFPDLGQNESSSALNPYYASGPALLENVQANAASASGTMRMVEPPRTARFDVVVVGGGAAALSVAAQASKYGRSVCLCSYDQSANKNDLTTQQQQQQRFYSPASKGQDADAAAALFFGDCHSDESGAVLKQIFKHASSLAQTIEEEAEAFGWKISSDTPAAVVAGAVLDSSSATEAATASQFQRATRKHDWERLAEGVRRLRRSAQSEAIDGLRKSGVAIVQTLPTIADSKRLVVHAGTEHETHVVTNVMILTPFLKPKMPNIPGLVEHARTVEQVFSLERPPGKTLIVGTSSGALETAGLLARLGYPVTVLVRSAEALRKYDRDVVGRILQSLERHGVVIKNDVNLVSVQATRTGKTAEKESPTLVAKFSSKLQNNGSSFTESFDTVLTSVGRIAHVDGLGLEKLGLLREESTGRIIVDESDTTSMPGIYAIGGITNRACLHFAAAEHSARLLCQRLFRASRAVCDYDFVPSAIFTPLEYGYVGLTEEEACKRLGRDRVSVYHRTFMPTHYHLLPPGGRSEKDRECYAKVVCDGFQDDRLIGLHIAGYKASEIIQGFALAMSLGATKGQLDSMIGLHPTAAENLVQTSAREANLLLNDSHPVGELGLKLHLPTC